MKKLRWVSKFKFKTITAGFLIAVQKGETEKGKEARKGEKRETKTGLKKPAGTGQKNGGKNRRLLMTDRNALANNRN